MAAARAMASPCFCIMIWLRTIALIPAPKFGMDWPWTGSAVAAIATSAGIRVIRWFFIYSPCGTAAFIRFQKPMARKRVGGAHQNNISFRAFGAPDGRAERTERIPRRRRDPWRAPFTLLGGRDHVQSLLRQPRHDMHL